jgi:hypothetical protein
MMSGFSAFFSWAAFVELNDPAIPISPSITITLLCEIALSVPIIVGTPWLAKKSGVDSIGS